MNIKYSNKEKQAIIEKYKSGISVATLVAETCIPRSTIYAWIKASRQNENREISIKNFRCLENKVKRLEGIIEILQKVDCQVSDTLNIKLNALEKLYGQYSVHMLCDALKVSRGTFYNHILRNKRDNAWYAKRREENRLKIQQIYDDSHQIFGADKITAIMKSEGYIISVEMVRELMRDMGLISIRQDAKNLYDKEQRKYKNHLNQQFTTTRPNEVWVSDITYFRFNNKNYYICAIIDLYSRKLVAYKIGKANSTQLVKSTFKIAFEERNPQLPLLFHTDQGANYRSNTFCSYLKSLNVSQSFSRAHIPYDNSVMESFSANLKREELYRTKYRSENEFRTAVDNYAVFYNDKRPHAKNKYKTPNQKEYEYYSDKAV